MISLGYAIVWHMAMLSYAISNSDNEIFDIIDDITLAYKYRYDIV